MFNCIKTVKSRCKYSSEIVAILLFFVMVSEPASSASWISFNTAPVNEQGSTSIRGLVSKPEGDGPFPAVIIAHGCFGVEPNHHIWAQRLNNWGYVAMIVDSFSSRGVSTVCESPNQVSPETRACDIYGAAAYLRKQSFVSPQKIGMIGFSHGGWTALYVAQDYLPEQAAEEPIQAIVSYYPWCESSSLKTTASPLLILSGKADDWTPVKRCYAYIDAQDRGYSKHISLQVFDKAYHGFDDSSMIPPVIYEGYTIAYDQSAAEASIIAVKAFLERHLN
ncbi:dienelactone hydrolase family protein [Moritella sp. Urea-trap-13]|uniref:dienelactone hydrolase family protein n=1 Tax=Moritella sp. Urea-trap-13 TaxID=2058327 RepID=UPI000C33337A|nr:dienelactone hydrolase family protein [Moritella sp. Urea-trap-13]PKH09331.1 dienelactone hydrolase family protein [Moritella sp. Urea-trap-13]